MSKREYKCQLCKNHGILTPFRGHKSKCPYNRCSCFNCKTTQIRRAETKRSRVSRTHGYEPDKNKRAINDVESNENQKVIAWINGEEDESEEAHASEQVQNDEDELQQTVSYGVSRPSTPANGQVPGLINKVTTSAGTASDARLSVKLPRVTLKKTLSSVPAPQASQATTEGRTQILKQIKELHDLKECGALSAKEFKDAKAVVWKDFK